MKHHDCWAASPPRGRPLRLPTRRGALLRHAIIQAPNDRATITAAAGCGSLTAQRPRWCARAARQLRPQQLQLARGTAAVGAAQQIAVLLREAQQVRHHLVHGAVGDVLGHGQPRRRERLGEVVAHAQQLRERYARAQVRRQRGRARRDTVTDASLCVANMAAASPAATRDSSASAHAPVPRVRRNDRGLRWVRLAPLARARALRLQVRAAHQLGAEARAGRHGRHPAAAAAGPPPGRPTGPGHAAESPTSRPSAAAPRGGCCRRPAVARRAVAAAPQPAARR